MPAIFTGFRIAAGLSVIGAVVGEIFFKRGDKGVGILLDSYRSRAQFPQMYGALILAAAARHRRLHLLRMAQQPRRRTLARVHPQERLTSVRPHTNHQREHSTTKGEQMQRRTQHVR